MAFKTDARGNPKPVTKTERQQLATGEKTIFDIFKHSEDLVISFCPNGTDGIWIKSKTNPKLGMMIGFALGDRGLLIQFRNLFGTNEMHIEKLTKEIWEVIQLKDGQQ